MKEFKPTMNREKELEKKDKKKKGFPQIIWLKDQWRKSKKERDQQPMSPFLAFTTDAMRLLEEEQHLQLKKKKRDPLKPKTSMEEKTSMEARLRAERAAFAITLERFVGVEGESAQRCKARLERHRRTTERVAKALAEKNMRDLLAQREQAERNRLVEALDAEVKRWSSGKEANLRALLSTLQYILGPDSGWQRIPLAEVITSAIVKKAYKKATLCVHPDKLQQRGASVQQKYICEKVFDLLKEAWNGFNSEEQ
ncbi:auxilin-related protein 2-like [Camellia sinensis]|uniref:auxilin-related protein 2-like n=1 Tax=Camellia sinensis TaxID=4442 RepID=UPI001035C187|nr:auxilin-related protein 2-like [Camellia sinensis]